MNYLLSCSTSTAKLCCLTTTYWKRKIFINNSVHMSLSNFYDTMIDYPQSKEYVMTVLTELFKREVVVSEKQLDKYKKHLDNLEKGEEY